MCLMCGARAGLALPRSFTASGGECRGLRDRARISGNGARQRPGLPDLRRLDREKALWRAGSFAAVVCVRLGPTVRTIPLVGASVGRSGASCWPRCSPLRAGVLVRAVGRSAPCMRPRVFTGSTGANDTVQRLTRDLSEPVDTAPIANKFKGLRVLASRRVRGC
jgi:hypothetical protein